MEYYKINEVVKQTGLSQHALRFYEKIGLIKIMREGESGIRKYSEENIEKLIMIIHLKKLEMTLEEIKEFFEEGKSVDSFKELFIAKKEKIKNQINELKNLDKLLDHALEKIENKVSPTTFKIPVEKHFGKLK
ncbi:MAG: MerR family transcriptional regulator [Fusobacteriaceae bacterium]